jgi:hypothetical protein
MAISFDPGSLMSAPDVSLPSMQPGMFGGGRWQNALMAAAAGFLARRSPQMSSNLMGAIERKQALAQQAALAELNSQRELQRQKDLYTFELQNPKQGDSEFERAAANGGYVPGSPEWRALMKRKADAMANPMVMTPYGPMPYSAVTAPQVPTAPVGKITPINGGPTPPASGSFPY